MSDMDQESASAEEALFRAASDLDRDRALLTQQIAAMDDPELLWRLREVISAHDEARAESHMQSLRRLALRWHLESGVEAHVTVEAQGALEAVQVKTAQAMFWVSAASLCVFGLILMLLIEPYQFVAPDWLRAALGWTWWALVSVALTELGALAWVSARSGERLSKGFWIIRAIAALMPPLRMGLHLGTRPDLLWLPKLGWTRTNQALFEKLRDDFSPMMIGVSLMIIPLLIVELRYEAVLLESAPWLPLFTLTQTCQALIWVAFTFEFIIMASVYEDRAEYVQTNWIDALIILFPLMSFFRLARVVQLAKGYRLRVLLTRLRQAAVLAKLLRRFALISPPARQLARMRRRLRVNHRERQEIENMIHILLQRLERRRQAEAAREARDAREADEARDLLRAAHPSSPHSEPPP
jgi:hypothetical protein